MKSGELVQPTQELGGESLVDYFAGMLFDETIAMYFVETRSGSAPIFADAATVLARRDKIDQHLREEGLYFYGSGGSVFMDYKNMRDRKYAPDGALSRWTNEHIKPTMSAQEAFEVCKKEVATWWK